MPDEALKEAISQVANALTVSYGLITTLRKDAEVAHQNAVALDKSLWAAVAALRRLQPKNGGSR